MLAFDDMEPIAERVYLAVDVSGSMGWSHVAGLSNLTAREAAAAMAMVVARHAERHVIKGFSAAGGTDRAFGRWTSRTAMQALPITGSSTLREAVEATSDLPFGGTDCALPMLDALEQGIEADAFVVLTDNETWAGRMHPSEALRLYRRKTGIPARLVVVGMTATECSIADPEDAGMLDVVGFDTAAPNVIGDFIGGAVDGRGRTANGTLTGIAVERAAEPTGRHCAEPKREGYLPETQTPLPHSLVQRTSSYPASTARGERRPPARAPGVALHPVVARVPAYSYVGIEAAPAAL